MFNIYIYIWYDIIIYIYMYMCVSCVCVWYSRLMYWFIVLRRHVVLFFLLLLDSLRWPRRQFFFTQKILFDVLNALWYFMIMFHRRYCLWNFGFGACLPGVTSSALYWSSRLSGSIPEICWGFGAAQALIDMAILTLWQSAESKCCMLIFAVGFKALHCNV